MVLFQSTVTPLYQMEVKKDYRYTVEPSSMETRGNNSLQGSLTTGDMAAIETIVVNEPAVESNHWVSTEEVNLLVHPLSQIHGFQRSKITVVTIQKLVNFVLQHTTGTTTPKVLRHVIYLYLTNFLGSNTIFFGVPCMGSLQNAIPLDWSESILVVRLKDSNQTIVIDVDFKSKFIIVRATPQYRRYLNMLPVVIVSTTKQLKRKLTEITASMELCLTENNIPVAPWRSEKQLLAMYMRYEPSSVTSTAFTMHEKITLRMLRAALEHSCPHLRVPCPNVPEVPSTEGTTYFDSGGVEAPVETPSALTQQLLGYFTQKND